MDKAVKDTGLIWDLFWSGFDLADFTDVNKINDLWTAFHLDILKREITSLPKNSLFLEAGCGLGQWCFYAAGVGHRAVGVDVAEDIINRLNVFIRGKKEYSEIRFLVDDLMSSKLESDQFDYIVSLGVIEHFHDSMPMLKEMRRLLKPGGRIFISVPNLFSMHTVTRPLTKLLGLWRIGYEKSFSPCGLRSQLDGAGFKMIEQKILVSGHLFGRVLNSLPVIGRFINRLGRFIEKRQSIFGIYMYAIATK